MQEYLYFIINNIFEISRIFAEFFILILLFRFRIRESYRESLPLSQKVIDDLIVDFTPTNLVDISNLDLPVLDKHDIVYELSEYDFFDLKNQNKKEVEEIIRVYGVGTCGPPGFYGTLDIHLELEKKISEVLGTEDAILYSNNFACINSVITCFCKYNDVIFYYKNSNEAIVRGISITKATSICFSNLEDLKTKVKLFSDIKKRNYLIAEGIYKNTGEILNIPELIKIKYEYGVRIIIDESLSIPLLGRRGVSEYFSLDINDIDLVIGSLAHVYCSNGGFSAGSKHAVDYQRLSSASYCFSASMPGFLAKAAILNIDAASGLRNENINKFHEMFKSTRYIIVSHEDSPMIIITNKNNLKTEDTEYFAEEYQNLWKFKKQLQIEKIGVGIIKNPFPSIRLCIKHKYSKKEIKYIVNRINDILK